MNDRALLVARPEAAVKLKGTAGRLARALMRDWPTLLAVVFLLSALTCAVGARFVAPYDPLKPNLVMRNRPPMTAGSVEGQFPHILGTDPLGRDVFSRLVFGSRVSLAVGAASVLVSGTLGVLLGLMAGYHRGRVDDIIMRTVDLMSALPTLLVALFVLFVIGPGITNLVLVLALVRWPNYARLARSMTLSHRESAFVEGAEALGASAPRIIFRHILPHLLSPILVLGTLEFAAMVLAEASLSFLGFGIQPPQPSWGLDVSAGREYIMSAWWLVTFPGIMILLTTLSLNLLGTWVRAITDPVQRWRWLMQSDRRARGAGSAGVQPADPRLEYGTITVQEPAAKLPDSNSVRPLLEVADLYVEFQTLEGVSKAVNGISYTLGRQETLAIVGESGAGKSISAEAVMGILESPPARVTAASLVYDGRDLQRMSKAERRSICGDRIGLVAQDALTALNPTLTVGYQIEEMYRVHRGISRQEARKKAVECLERVGIPMAPQRVRDYPHQFSGGMRQRAMIAMALALEPDILIADEPTTALDVTVQAQIMELLTRVQAEANMSLILITHDLALVAEIADRIIVMYAGRIVESGPCTEIYRNMLHPYTKGLMQSIPRADYKSDRLGSIPGAPPDPKNIPSGCAFHPRCPCATDLCRVEIPPLRAVSENHHVACCMIGEP